MLALVDVHAHRAECVAIGTRVPESNVAQARRDGRHETGGLDGVELVHVGNPVEPFQNPRQRPPAQQRDDDDVHDHRDHDRHRPVVQECREPGAQILGRPLAARHRGDDVGDAVDVRGHRREDQLPQPPHQQQDADDVGPERRARDHRCAQHRDDAAARALDDARQAADVGTEHHGHQSAHAGDQERDGAAGNGRGHQHAESVAVGQQSHRDRAQHAEARGERHDDGDDGGGGAQRRHHGGLGVLARIEGTGLISGAGSSHCTILPAA
ncbi:Uncharacterised protein [Mycobacteroides abscessus subsp. abscessus]|nr:Uncharacterised protein [Mycobacteroides abscessus subsp. abscessus]